MTGVAQRHQAGIPVTKVNDTDAAVLHPEPLDGRNGPSQSLTDSRHTGKKMTDNDYISIVLAEHYLLYDRPDTVGELDNALATRQLLGTFPLTPIKQKLSETGTQLGDWYPFQFPHFHLSQIRLYLNSQTMVPRNCLSRIQGTFQGTGINGTDVRVL